MIMRTAVRYLGIGRHDEGERVASGIAAGMAFGGGAAAGSAEGLARPTPHFL